MGKWKSVYSELKDRQNQGAEDRNSSMFGAKTGLPKGMVETPLPNIYTNHGQNNFDPRDCSNPRNSTSPFCGYNPISTRPFSVGVGLTVNACSTWIRIQPTVGFIDFPPSDLVLLNRECRKDYLEENGKNYEGDLPQEPSNKVVAPPKNFPPTPDQNIPDLALNCWYLVHLGYKLVGVNGITQTEEGSGFVPFYDPNVVKPLSPFGQPTGTSWAITSRLSTETHYEGGTNSRQVGAQEQIFPPIKTSNTETLYPGNWLLNDGRDIPLIRYDLYSSDPTTPPLKERTWAEDYTGWQKWEHVEERKFVQASGLPLVEAWKNASSRFRNRQEASWMNRQYGLIPAIHSRLYNSSTGKVGLAFHPDNGVNPNIFAGKGRDIMKYFAETEWTDTNFGGVNAPNISYFVIRIVPLPCGSSKAWENPPAEICDCMSCCNPQDDRRREQKQDKIIADLEEIKKRLGSFPVTASVWDDNPKLVNAQKKDRQIKSVADGLVSTHERANHTQHVLGIEQYPLEMPDSLIEPVAQSGVEQIWNWFNPKKKRKITNLVDYIDWIVDQFDGKIGHSMQYLEYEVVEGKKKVKKKIVLADLMTAIRELYKQSIAQMQMSGMQTDISLKTLQQTTQNAVLIVRIDKVLADIQNYLDYVTGEKVINVPVQISPNENSKNLEQYLQPSTLQITHDEWKPGVDTSLVDDLDDIKNTLSIIRMQLGGEGV